MRLQQLANNSNPNSQSIPNGQNQGPTYVFLFKKPIHFGKKRIKDNSCFMPQFPFHLFISYIIFDDKRDNKYNTIILTPLLLRLQLSL